MAAPKRAPRNWKRSQQITLLALSLLVALLGAEVATRLLGEGPGPARETVGEIPWKYRPGYRFVHRQERVNRIVMNNWGFHDTDRRSTSSVPQLLVLGDSFVEALQVPVEQLFTKITEQTLKRAGYDVEIINAGIRGTGTAHQYLLWRDFFSGRIDLDRVIVVICNGNDLPNNQRRLEEQINGHSTDNKAFVRPDGSVLVVPPAPVDETFRQRFLDPASNRSAFIKTLRQALHRLRRQRERGSDASGGKRRETASLEAEWQDAVAGTLNLLRSWHAELKTQGTTLSIVVLPWANPENIDYGHPAKAEFVVRLRALAEKEGFPVLELDFSHYQPVEVFSFDGTTLGHLNTRGHEVASEQLAEFLTGLLDSARRPPVTPSSQLRSTTQ